MDEPGTVAVHGDPTPENEVRVPLRTSGVFSCVGCHRFFRSVFFFVYSSPLPPSHPRSTPCFLHGTKQSIFTHLPPEVSLYILAFLSRRDLAAVRLACRRLRDLASDRSLYRSVVIMTGIGSTGGGMGLRGDLFVWVCWRWWRRRR